MKKIYLLLMVAICAISASATSPRTFKISNDLFKSISTNRSKSPKLETVNSTASDVQMAPPTSTQWTKTSTGIWTEGPMVGCGAVPKLDNYTWEVDVYTAEDAPGWYRLNPYPTGNPVRDSIGSANRSLLYINASDPKKVYIDSWNAFNQFTFNNIAPEGGMASGNSYGTYFGGIVKFPAKTLYLTYGGKNYYVDGPTQLIIDKDNYKDYAAAPEVDFCFAPGEGKMNFKTSADLSM